MSLRNQAWALSFQPLDPVHKFVLLMLADRCRDQGDTDDDLPFIERKKLKAVQEVCCVEPDRFKRIVEELQKRGLVREAPGQGIELCTFQKPELWNSARQAEKNTLTKANGNGVRHREVRR